MLRPAGRAAAAGQAPNRSQPQVVRASTIPQGTLDVQASGVIYDYFEKVFIRAETIADDETVTGKGQ